MWVFYYGFQKKRIWSSPLMIFIDLLWIGHICLIHQCWYHLLWIRFSFHINLCKSINFNFKCSLILSILSITGCQIRVYCGIMESNMTNNVLEELLNIEVELQDVQGKVSLPSISFDFIFYISIYFWEYIHNLFCVHAYVAASHVYNIHKHIHEHMVYGPRIVLLFLLL